MYKVVRPCLCEVYSRTGTAFASAFVKIEYKDDKLSLTGVIGPMRNGNCMGAAGQCADEIRKGKPTERWDGAMLQKLCNIWDRWHLNDMTPECEHQRQLGWKALASKKVPIYHYRMTRDASKKQKDAEKAALDALKRGEAFHPTEEQTKFAAMPYFLESPVEISGEDAENYEPKTPMYAGDTGPVETKLLGWLYQKDHPDGILCKPCPVCGYKYGSAWLKEEVPQDVIDWLFELPETDKTPAWC